MYQFYTVEITKTHEGELSHDVKWHWDEDQDKARLKAESKFHEIMSRAAVSEYAMHSVILFSEEGMLVANGCYTHPEDAANESVTIG
jgi:hypothetical protein